MLPEHVVPISMKEQCCGVVELHFLCTTERQWQLRCRIDVLSANISDQLNIYNAFMCILLCDVFFVFAIHCVFCLATDKISMVIMVVIIL